MSVQSTVYRANSVVLVDFDSHRTEVTQHSYMQLLAVMCRQDVGPANQEQQ